MDRLAPALHSQSYEPADFFDVVAPQNDSRLLRLRGTVAALVATGLLVSGCEAEDVSNVPTAAVSTEVSVSDNQACVAGQTTRGDILLYSDFMSQTQSDYGSVSKQGVEDLAGEVAQLPSWAQPRAAVMVQYLDGKVALTGLPTYDIEKAAAQIATAKQGIQDPEVVAELDAVVDGLRAEDVTSGLINEQEYLEKRTQVDAIADPTLKDAVRKSLLASYMYIGGFNTTVSDGLALANPDVQADIAADPELAPLLQAYGDALQSKSSYRAWSSILGDLSRVYNERNMQVMNLTVSPYKAQDDLENKLADVRRAARDDITSRLVSANQIAGGLEDAQGMNLEFADNHVFDFSGVDGEEICLSQASPSLSGSYEGDSIEKTMRQFAGVAIENGTLQLSYAGSAAEQLSDADKQALQGIVSRLQPWLEAAFASGALTQITLATTDGNVSPYYSSAKREAYILIDKGVKPTVDELQMIITHEIGHALTLPGLSETDTNVEGGALREAFVNSCDALHKYDVASSASMLSVDVDRATTALLADADPLYGPVFQALRDQSVNGKPLVDVVNDYVDRDGSYNCEDATFGTALNAVMNELGIKHGSAEERAFFDKYDLDENMLVLSKDWRMGLENGAFKSLNESQYIQTDTPSKKYAGHSGENSDEAMASLLDYMMNDTSGLIEVLRGYGNEEQAVHMQLIHDAVALVSYYNPSLQTYLNGLEATIVQGVA